MCRLLKYSLSHLLYAAMTRLDEANKGVNMWSIRYLGYLSSLSSLVAICWGFYVQWVKTDNTIILVIFILGLFVLGIASILHYYFGMERVSLFLLHVWFGFLLGLLCFLNIPSKEEDVKEQVANYMLVASVVIRILWALVERMCGCTQHQPAFLKSREALELTGFAMASTTLVGHKSISLIALTLSLAALIVDLRMKSYLALPNLTCFSVVAAFFFQESLGVSTNPFALSCFLSRLVCDPFLDVYFSGLSVTERWSPLLVRRGFWRHLSLLPLVVVEVAFLIMAALKMRDLDRWYLLIPGLSVFTIIWIICHLVFLVTLWGFHSKLSDCQRLCMADMSEAGELDRVMASKGMRHFCLISKRLVLFSLVSTIILGALAWQPFNSLFIALFLLVLPLESLAHGLFHELGNSLGGTCVGYAVVIPTNYCSPDGQPTLLPPAHVQELNLRSTGMLNNVQRFFSHHMIETYGCDYSTSGLSLEALQAKLRNFMEVHTTDGPRHDTYMLFYSGHTHRSGEWALSGGDILRLDKIVQLWREKNAGFCSRLIIILDTENSLPWVKEVQNIEGLYVAVQGAVLCSPTDLELQDTPQLGDFTSQWVDFNCNPESIVRWSERGRTVRAFYGISRHWSDYKLHLPTEKDVTRHWSLYFPRLTYPVVQLAHWCGGLNLFWVCGYCIRLLRRVKLTWFPPAVLDTGQGFKLVKS
ncbi:transmembrane protein 168-like [Myxocyprinus asiaticus]|uniref:transmembrane protein 168-like n=1 Tax=Myxocyprinus asiaticus TaxID=70543 RepID=UPI0022238E3A|nr:transmembrane protein 168-like [Myxocyprinus asiaticus]